MKLVVLLVLSASLMACGPKQIIVEKPVEVRVPVAQPCISGARPVEPVPLNRRIPRDQWDALSTDQRENLALAQGLDRKIHADRLLVATAGCN